MLKPNKNLIYSCSHCSCASFLTFYSSCTEVMLIFNLIDVQYLQNVNFSFGKGSNGQNLLLLVVPPPDSKFLLQNFSFPPTAGRTFPLSLYAIWKILHKLHLHGFPPLLTFCEFDLVFYSMKMPFLNVVFK